MAPLSSALLRGNEDWLNWLSLWAGRFGESAAQALLLNYAACRGTFEVGIRHSLPQQASDAYADAEVGGRGT